MWRDHHSFEDNPLNVEKSDEIPEIRSVNLRKLSDYETVTSKILSLVAKDTQFLCRPALDQILLENERLIVVFNHASPISWIPAPCLLTAHCVARGGGGRRPIAVMDRFFYSLPIFRDLAKFVTQSDRPLNFEQLVEHFETLKTADLVVFPEGSNCFFGEPTEMQPFRSDRFVEIAIRTKTPMLLCVHRGSEEWGISFPVDPRWTERIPLPAVFKNFFRDRLNTSGRLTVPLWPSPMPVFKMRCEIHRPKLETLAEDRAERREQLRQEAEEVHKKMRSMLLEIDS